MGGLLRSGGERETGCFADSLVQPGNLPPCLLHRPRGFRPVMDPPSGFGQPGLHRNVDFVFGHLSEK